MHWKRLALTPLVTLAAIAHAQEVPDNQAPAVSSVSISPSLPKTTDALSCKARGTDPEGQAVTFEYSWMLEGASVGSAEKLNADATKKGQTYTCMVTPVDSKGLKGEANAAEVVTVGNTAPTLADVALAPEKATTTDSFTCKPGEAADVDGDSVSFTYRWLASGVAIDGQTSKTLPASATRKGQSISCEATPTDGTDSGSAKRSAARSIANTPPTLASAKLDKSTALTNESLKCEPGEPSDADDDSVSFRYGWTVDDNNTGYGGQTLPSGYFKKGQKVVCEVTPRDSSGASGESVKTAATTIANSAPKVSSATLSNSGPRTDQAISCRPGSRSDADGDSVEFVYTWKVNDAVVADVSGAELPADKFKKNQKITCTVTPTDGENKGEPVTTEPAVSKNTVPVLASVELTPEKPSTTDSMSCRPGDATDADGDSVSSSYQWLVSGGVVAGQTGKTLPSSAFRKGQSVQCVVTPNDGEADGRAVRSASRIAANTPPTLAKASIDKSAPMTGDSLKCEPSGGADDDDDRLYYSYAWYVGDSRVSTSQTLSSGYFKRGDSVACEATPSDGTAKGDPAKSSAVTIVNTPPKLSSASVSPTRPTGGDDITCKPGYASDADQDEVSFDYKWTADGSVVGSNSETLPASATMKNQEIVCTVTPKDASASGEPAASSPIKVLNTPPVLEAATVTPSEPSTTDSLVCKPGSAADADGDSVAYDYRWTANGAYIGDGSKLDSSKFRKNQSVVCTVTPKDDDGNGRAVASSAVRVANTPPVLSSVSLEPVAPFTNQSVSCTPGEASDDDNDRVYYNYAWTVDGEAVASTSSTLYSSSFKRDQTVQCTATPRDGTDEGGAKKSNTITVKNSPPTVSSASLGPYSPKTDTPVKCTAGRGYDRDNDEVSFTFAWEVDGKAVSGSGEELSTGQYDKGDEIRCLAIPTDGTDKGEPAKSNAVTVVNSPPVVSAVVLSPAEVFTDDTLKLTARASDPDGDPVTLTYQWLVNGRAVYGQDGTTLDGGEHFDRDNQIVARVVANDGTVNSARADSEPLKVSNTPPTATNVFIGDTEGGFVDLHCNVALESTDLDGDRVRYKFEFFVDGEKYTGSTLSKTLPGDAVPSRELDLDETWRCVGTPTDGTSDGPSADWSTTIVPGVAGGGSSHACALTTNGEIACWGLDDYGVATPPNEGDFRRLAVGGWHNCAILSDGDKLQCWGHRTYGQDRPPKGAWREVTSGWWHSCAINAEGEAACWGQTADGRTEVPEGKRFSAIDAGGQHTCAIETSGSLLCWGKDDSGLLSPPAGSFTQVTSGEHHSCALKADGTAVCWGSNDSAQLDVPSHKFEYIAAGARHNCGVTTEQDMVCWGLNNYDQLKVPEGKFRLVGKGVGHTCGLDTGGSVVCWGKNNYAQAEPPERLIKGAEDE